MPDKKIHNQKEYITVSDTKYELVKLLGESSICDSYLVVSSDDKKEYVLNIVYRPEFKDVRPLLESHHQFFEDVFLQDKELVSIYGCYSSKAALEIYTSSIEAQVYLVREILRKSAQNPHFPLLKTFSKDKTAWYFILNYVHGNNIYDYIQEIGRENETKVFDLMKQIASALSFLHKSELGKILYANLTPSNIIVDAKGIIHLTDLFKMRFAYENDIDNDHVWQNLVIDPVPGPFMPWEGYKNERSEIYSLGILFYYCLTDLYIQNSKERMKSDKLLPIRNINSSLSRKVSKIINFSLELLPERRFRTFEDLEKSLDNRELGSITLEYQGKKTEEIYIGTFTGKQPEKKVVLNFIKPLEIETVPMLIERFKYTSPHKDSLAPKVTLKQISEQISGISTELTIEVAADHPPGPSEIRCIVSSTWGICEFKVKFHMYAVPFYSKRYMGGVYAFIFMALLLLLRTPDKDPGRYWGRNWWNWMKTNTLVLSSMLIYPSDSDYFKIYPVNKKIVSVFTEHMFVFSGKNLKPKERTGILTESFLPLSPYFETGFIVKNFKSFPKGMRFSAQLFSSNMNTVKINIDSGKDILIVSEDSIKNRTFKKNPYDFISPESTDLKIKMLYSTEDYTIRIFIGDKEALVLTEQELKDFAVYFYVASLNGGNIYLSVSDAYLKSDTPIDLIPPYSMISNGKFTAFRKPQENAPYSFTIKQNEAVEVEEERGEWVRVKTSRSLEQEGWIKERNLRRPKPSEALL